MCVFQGEVGGERVTTQLASDGVWQGKTTYPRAPNLIVVSQCKEHSYHFNVVKLSKSIQLI